MCVQVYYAAAATTTAATATGAANSNKLARCSIKSVALAI
jgi:hypothetical protein